MPKERMIDANALLERMKKDPLFPFVEEYGISRVIEAEPTVEAIITDDNFGFAAYIIENNKYGIRVEETWNKDLDDEEMMAVMTGLIQDILADERLTRLWNDATDLAKFMMGVGDNIARVS